MPVPRGRELPQNRWNPHSRQALRGQLAECNRGEFGWRVVEKLSDRPETFHGQGTWRCSKPGRMVQGGAAADLTADFRHDRCVGEKARTTAAARFERPTTRRAFQCLTKTISPTSFTLGLFPDALWWVSAIFRIFGIVSLCTFALFRTFRPFAISLANDLLPLSLRVPFRRARLIFSQTCPRRLQNWPRNLHGPFSRSLVMTGGPAQDHFIRHLGQTL